MATSTTVMHFCSILQMFFVTSILQLLVFGHAEHDFMDLATFRLDKIPLKLIIFDGNMNIILNFTVEEKRFYLLFSLV